jgi:hypothetical protein
MPAAHDGTAARDSKGGAQGQENHVDSRQAGGAVAHVWHEFMSLCFFWFARFFSLI